MTNKTSSYNRDKDRSHDNLFTQIVIRIKAIFERRTMIKKPSSSNLENCANNPGSGDSFASSPPSSQRDQIKSALKAVIAERDARANGLYNKLPKYVDQRHL